MDPRSTIPKLIYVDNTLCIYDDSNSILPKPDKYFLLKHGSVREPDVYLGAKLKYLKWRKAIQNTVHFIVWFSTYRPHY